MSANNRDGRISFVYKPFQLFFYHHREKTSKRETQSTQKLNDIITQVFSGTPEITVRVHPDCFVNVGGTMCKRPVGLLVLALLTLCASTFVSFSQEDESTPSCTSEFLPGDRVSTFDPQSERIPTFLAPDRQYSPGQPLLFFRDVFSIRGNPDDYLYSYLQTLIKHVGCQDGNPIWFIQDEMDGMRGWIFERNFSGDTILILEQRPESPWVPTVINYHGYCDYGLGIPSAAGVHDVLKTLGCWQAGAGIEIFEPIDHFKMCEYIYGTKDGYPLRPIPVYSPDRPYVPADCWGYSPMVSDSEGWIIGASRDAFTNPYVFVPAVIHPSLLLVYPQPDERSTPLGSATIGYYQVVEYFGEWTRIATVDWTVGWIKTSAIYLGTLSQNGDIQIDDILSQSENVPTAYIDGTLPDKYGQAHELLTSQYVLENPSPIKIGHLVYQVIAENEGNISIIDIVCLVPVPTALEDDLRDLITRENVEVLCTIVDLQGIVIAVASKHYITAYIAAFVLVITNVDAITEQVDSWMMPIYQWTWNCPITRHLYGYCASVIKIPAR